MRNAKCKIKKCREKRGVLPEGVRHLFSLLDVELFGIDDCSQEGAEIVFVALGEAVLRHGLGLFFGYVQEIIVGGLGDAQPK